ncbi:MAG: HAMP domain-containing histidine kinase [Clostridiales bacterium]|jgi:signal transduction histidine kinase|nr:HAMP domain-containing histidine kinase [Clostridiales bacterium]
MATNTKPKVCDTACRGAEKHGLVLSVTWRLFLGFAAALLVFGLLICLAVRGLLGVYIMTYAKSTLARTADDAERILDGTTVPELNHEGGESLTHIATASGHTIVLRGGPGDPQVFGSPPPAEDLTNGASAGDDKDGSFYLKHAADDGERTFLVYERVLDGGYTMEVRAAYRLNPYLKQINNFTAFTAIASILLGFVWSFFFAHRFVKPLRTLNDAAHRIARQDFSQKVDLPRQDTFGELGQSIQSMQEQLSDLFTELQDKNARLETELNRERENDVMRKQFVADVSHELKTPLTVIAGYAEALEQGMVKNEDKKREYARVIAEETGRMNKLVMGLLDLSRVQSKAYRLELAPLEMTDFLGEVLERHVGMLEAQGVTLSSIVAEGTVQADRGRLEQIVANYLTNAAAHAAGKMQVTVTGKAEDGQYVVTVFNTGAPIPAEEQAKIWDAFYRGDAARKRETGRFGLGLSIVSALVALHGGTCGVENVPGGVQFYFSLPLYREA